MTWTASWVDSEGNLCASGTSENKDLAKQEAKRNLDAYLAKKKDDGESVSQRDLSLKIKRDK